MCFCTTYTMKRVGSFDNVCFDRETEMIQCFLLLTNYKQFIRINESLKKLSQSVNTDTERKSYKYKKSIM